MKALDKLFLFSKSFAVSRSRTSPLPGKRSADFYPPDESLPPRAPSRHHHLQAVEMWPIHRELKNFLCEPPKHKVKHIQHVWRLRCSFRVRGLWQALPREKL